MKTVLASVSDKTGLVELLQGMAQTEPLRVIATGSTAQYLTEQGIQAETVESLTGFPEIMEGRVKTLHPKVFGAILAKDTAGHIADREAHGIPRLDVVIVNLYPFESVVSAGAQEAKAIENIDIGGVALIRAAAKNYAHVAVLVTPAGYPDVLAELQAQQGWFSEAFRRKLACTAFAHTARYDSLIAGYFQRTEEIESAGLPQTLNLTLEKVEDLRYGENPHQRAAWYRQHGQTTPLPFTQLQGKEMSANNIVDAHAAFAILREFPADPACCVIKHNNPCGAAIGATLEEAYRKAYEADPVSAFGGIFGFNATVTEAIATRVTENFIEIVMAPTFTPEALDALSRKKNVRVLQVPGLAAPAETKTSWTLKDLEEFGLLLQENTLSPELPELSGVTSAPLPESTRADAAFGWAIVKHLTSNAIVVVKDGQTIGFGIGQTSRIASMEQALRQAGDRARGAVLASDGFFPATDNIDAAAQAGIAVIIQPGGSIKDPDVIDAANHHGLSMAFTHQRCFKH